MFVTSDIFDLKRVGRFRRIDWRENLLGGVDVYGRQWPGYEAGAAFLLEATKHCGLLGEMIWAGYNRPGDKRTRPLAPKSFERLTRSELAGARTAESVLFKGRHAAPGSKLGVAVIGGEASGSPPRIRTLKGPLPIADYPYRPFSAHFVFPVDEHPIERATDLFQLAVESLGAEYGYYFVRDVMCGPWIYTSGMTAPLDWGSLEHEDAEEIGSWCDFVGEGRLWTERWPTLRDLFQVNLLSERHTSTAIEGLGYLHEWIVAQPGRGRLEDAGKGRLLWVLTDAEMYDVRPVLNAAGLLRSCHERIYRDLPQGLADAQRIYAAQSVPYARWSGDVLLDYPDRFRR